MNYAFIIVVALAVAVVVFMAALTFFILKNTEKEDKGKTTANMYGNPDINQPEQDGYIKDFFDINSGKDSGILSSNRFFADEDHTVGVEGFGFNDGSGGRGSSPSMQNHSNPQRHQGGIINNNMQNEDDDFKTVSFDEYDALQPGYDETQAMPSVGYNMPNIVFRYRDGDTQKVLRMMSDKVLVGRGVGNDLMLGKNTFTSRNHAIFSIVDGKLHLKDLNSKNGTFVNGTYRVNGEVIIEGSCEVSFGDTVVNVEIG